LVPANDDVATLRIRKGSRSPLPVS
jgi:hypothetical protein